MTWVRCHIRLTLSTGHGCASYERSHFAILRVEWWQVGSALGVEETLGRWHGRQVEQVNGIMCIEVAFAIYVYTYIHISPMVRLSCVDILQNDSWKYYTYVCRTYFYTFFYNTKVRSIVSLLNFFLCLPIYLSVCHLGIPSASHSLKQ